MPWLSGAEPDADLIEWDHGGYEGLTAEQIQELVPGWELWRDGVEVGEDLGHVTVRVDAFLGRVRPALDEGDVAVVAHGHLSRILTARRLGLDASAARQFGHPHPRGYRWFSGGTCRRDGLSTPRSALRG
ncbi:histidine phosphatase family protein [Streptomyces sp. NPDC089795]|uniref:histidine phosphatase family protein n=1 Tax=Streptomyces sp. NPDC089795 TaxID=3155297 RepID=UPI00342CA8B2